VYVTGVSGSRCRDGANDYTTKLRGSDRRPIETDAVRRDPKMADVGPKRTESEVNGNGGGGLRLSETTMEDSASNWKLGGTVVWYALRFSNVQEEGFIY